jgi:hypothetical protein
LRIPKAGTQSHIILALAGNIEFGNPSTFGTQQSPQNIQGSWWQGTSPSQANTDFPVPHKLGFVPTGFDVKNINKAAHVFQGKTPWTSKVIYLQCDQPSTQLTLFVL